MDVVRHRTPEEFLARAGAWLGAAEAENNLILGIASGLLRHPDEAWLLTVEDGGAVAGAALITPPRILVLTRMPGAALEELGDTLHRLGAPLPGVVGPSEIARAFSLRWDPAARRALSERIYECDRIGFEGSARGEFREATPDLEPLLVEWGRQFCIDAGLDSELAAAPDHVRRLLADGRMVVWVDGGPVSMAARNADTPHGSRVSWVFTPSALRRRGYATALVAALTHRVLDSGRRFCFLYTDLANPTSNSIYQSIGYRPVSDAEVWVFGDQAGVARGT